MSTSKKAKDSSKSSKSIATKNIAIAPDKSSGSSSSLSLHGRHLRKLCKKHLPWNDDDITSWITKHTLPYLKHWKTTCYDDTVLRNTLHSLLANFEKKCATQQKILDLCISHEERLCSPSLFATLPAGPSKYVARTAMEIHLLSFSKVVDWAAAFALCEDSGYKIAVELALMIFQDLWRNGSTSWFQPLLKLGPKPHAFSNNARGQKRKLEVLDTDEHDEQEASSRKRTRVGSPIDAECHGKGQPLGNVHSLPEVRSMEVGSSNHPGDHKRNFEAANSVSHDEPAERRPQRARVDSQTEQQYNGKDGEPLENISKDRKIASSKASKRTNDEVQPNTSNLTTPKKTNTGKALNRTRVRNEHRREQMKLKRFIAIGLLPPDANFATLRKKRADLEADREKGVERALAEAAETAKVLEAEKRRERLKVTFRFTGHRKELLGEILSTGRDEAKKRNELATRFPGYHGVEPQSASVGDCVLGMGCERKASGKDCIMCSTFGKL